METVEHWQVDPEHSRFRFTLHHLVIHEIRGSFGTWGGELVLHRKQPSHSRVAIWIDLSSLDTGEPERDEQVRSSEFLDIARFPRAEFRSTRVTLRDHAPAAVTGELSLHGVTHELEMEVGAERDWTDADGRLHAAYTIHGHLDRQRYGLRWNQDLDTGGVVVADQIEIEVEVALLRAPLQAPLEPPQRSETSARKSSRSPATGGHQ
jgi:polyisoprenoid-binding protein YceI